MSVIIAELVDRHQYVDVLAGFEITRVFHVSGLIEAPNRQLIEASDDPGIPQLGFIYPGTTGILCVRREVTPDGPNAARVVCIYSAERNVSSYNQPEPAGNDGQDVKQISAGLREVMRTKDRDGAPMTLTPPAGSGDGWPSYNSEARVFLPMADIVFERVETSPAVSRARGLVGTINNAALNNYPENTLLFVALDAVTNDGGYKWNVTYTFRYDSAGWKHFDSYHSPVDGKVPVGAEPVPFDVLFDDDFSTLGLDFSDFQTPIS